MIDAENERIAVIAWLRLPRKAKAAGMNIRFTLAFMALFRPNILVQWMNEVIADSIQEGAHIERKDDD